MRPETWLREPAVQRARKRLKFWQKEDFTTLAKHLFGTDDLTLEEIHQLVLELKKPGVSPPGGLIARDPVVITKDNPLRYTNSNKSRVYLSKDQIKIQFRDMKTALDWGYRLMVRTNLPWEKAKSRWEEGTKLSYFYEVWVNKLNIAGLLGLRSGEFELDIQLTAALNRLTVQWGRETLAYPDTTPVARKYASLGIGDKLVGPDGDFWEITGTKPKLVGHPQLYVEPSSLTKPSK